MLHRTQSRSAAILSAAAAACLAAATPAFANSAELAENYRRANDSQRLAYLEKVISETRFGSSSSARIRAMAAVAKACVDDWDPKLEDDFAAQVGSCVVLANRRVGLTP